VYKELKLGRYHLRYFPNKQPEKLFWHRDENDRNVRLLFGDVELQFDNELPTKMSLFKSNKIQGMTYHRVISKGRFIVFISE
jgi:hypothetical protein